MLFQVSTLVKLLKSPRKRICQVFPQISCQSSCRQCVQLVLAYPLGACSLWQLLTISRPVEAAEARWDEINFEAKEWKIPADRMKMNREHTVPLSDAALAILELMKPLSGHREFIFPSRIKPTQPMNSQTVNAALKRAGFGGVLVSHGLRSIASTALNE